MKRIQITKEQIESLVNEGLSSQQIADRLGLKISFVRHKLFKLRLKSKYKHKHSTKVKSELSLSRKSFLKSNPDKHPWRNKNKYKSVPCEKLKEWLRSNSVQFVEEFQPKIDDRFFSIDIAFPDKLIGIEVNGNQHYNSDGSLKPYYAERERIIESAGWKLYQLHYSICFKIQELEKIIPTIISSPEKREFNYAIYTRATTRPKLETKIKTKIILPEKEKILEILKTSSIEGLSESLGIKYPALIRRLALMGIGVRALKANKITERTHVCSCGEIKHRKSLRCEDCQHFSLRRIARPSKEELEKLIKTTPMTRIGENFKVSDNAVRKWCKSYGLALPNMLGYWAKQKNGATDRI